MFHPTNVGKQINWVNDSSDIPGCLFVQFIGKLRLCLMCVWQVFIRDTGCMYSVCVVRVGLKTINEFSMEFHA